MLGKIVSSTEDILKWGFALKGQRVYSEEDTVSGIIKCGANTEEAVLKTVSIIKKYICEVERRGAFPTANRLVRDARSEMGRRLELEIGLKETFDEWTGEVDQQTIYDLLFNFDLLEQIDRCILDAAVYAAFEHLSASSVCRYLSLLEKDSFPQPCAHNYISVIYNKFKEKMDVH